MRNFVKIEDKSFVWTTDEDHTQIHIEQSNGYPLIYTPIYGTPTAAGNVTHLSEGPADLPKVVLRDVLVQVSDVELEARKSGSVAEDDISLPGVLRLLFLSQQQTTTSTTTRGKETKGGETSTLTSLHAQRKKRYLLHHHHHQQRYCTHVRMSNGKTMPDM